MSSLSVLPIVRRRTATKMRGTELIVHTLTTLSLRPLASSVCLSLAFSIQYSVVAPPRAVSHGNFQPNGPVQTFCTTRTRPNSFIIAPANSFVIGPAVINTHSCSNKHTRRVPFQARLSVMITIFTDWSPSKALPQPKYLEKVLIQNQEKSFGRGAIAGPDIDRPDLFKPAPYLTADHQISPKCLFSNSYPTHERDPDSPTP